MAKKKKLKNFNPENLQNKRVITSAILVSSGVFLLFAFSSYLINWKYDQSILDQFSDRSIEAKNHLGKIGASVSHFFIYKGFGLGAFYLPYLFIISGIYILKEKSPLLISKQWTKGILNAIWWSVLLGFLPSQLSLFSGIVGLEINEYLRAFIGSTGLWILLLSLLFIKLSIKYKWTPAHIIGFIKKSLSKSSEIIEKAKSTPEEAVVVPEESKAQEIVEKTVIADKTEDLSPKTKLAFAPESSEIELKPTISNHSSIEKSEEPSVKIVETVETVEPAKEEAHVEVEIDVNTTTEESHLSENQSNKMVENFGEFDPTLELSNFKFPTLNLLKDYQETISVDQSELEANKNRIVQTLNNYKIGISQIKATVGPTVTLYEIVPDAGIRISKIKNLEDDIALSLSALGIRIIAPIPGKGTIGIEVPNKNSTIVSMRSVISSEKFQKSHMELPVALGKTISNETFVVDLAKMPHLLMAGATGQGKSVGLNAVLTSLLYKKHPAEVKFVLVDPKKVELTLFNKIERHYLAELPGSEEAIITDTAKVINTLNSLCIEMDDRYELLKKAMVRNIKEYNAKFKARKLNPENGHKFLPYIVLVIDEFADLIMTAGKEVETPIARLAQLARAIGIHLIVATQRPSVNVITGIIKANFPARVAFRVTSKIDSRTILDASGADQLIGKGDLLFSGGNDITRIQCAFVDTPEVEKITDFIGAQRAYPEAYQLPEYEGEEAGTSLDVDIADRDKLFKDAAEVIVTAQQGSASLLQRKLKLGYNRAGRLIDQLEAAGIVGPFEGSKARQVLVTDLVALEQLLENEKNV
ncbi:MAG: DNA translocase FtsK 4TM domain-containing protein [Flavobacteriaceae bacterium]